MLWKLRKFIKFLNKNAYIQASHDSHAVCLLLTGSQSAAARRILLFLFDSLRITPWYNAGGFDGHKLLHFCKAPWPWVDRLFFRKEGGSECVR